MNETTGWIVSLWIDELQTTVNNREELPYLSWSSYDRVTINEAKKFSDYFVPKGYPDWNGTVQRLHLIPKGECSWEIGKDCLISTQCSLQKNYGVYCIVTARYNCRILNIDRVEEAVNSRMQDYFKKTEIQWQLFQSLGAEDFVGIFLADSIAELAKAIEVVKQITYTNDEKSCSLFNSVCSFLGLNISNFQQEPKANLFIRLYLKSSDVSEKVYELLNNKFNDDFGTEGFTISEIVTGKKCFEVKILNHEKILTYFHNSEGHCLTGNPNFIKHISIKAGHTGM